MGKVLAHAQPAWAVLALAIFWASQIFSSLRCVYVARILGGTINLSTSLQAHFVGLWFNQVLPSSLGGDVIKIAMLKEPLGLSIALRSAILDRLSGFIFLLLAIALTLPLYAEIFSLQPNLTFALSVLSLAGIAVIVLCAWGAHYLQRSRSLHPVLLMLVQIFSDIWIFRMKGSMWGQFWTSAIVHFNGIAAYTLLVLALGFSINPLTLFLVVPLVFFVALIPISFAGWGVREAGAVWLFGIVGVGKESALAMSISFGLLLVVAGLPGLFLFLYQSSTRRASHTNAR
jgi:glycosyltransferase 2 family protein